MNVRLRLCKVQQRQSKWIEVKKLPFTDKVYVQEPLEVADAVDFTVGQTLNQLLWKFLQSEEYINKHIVR